MKSADLAKLVTAALSKGQRQRRQATAAGGVANTEADLNLLAAELVFVQIPTRVLMAARDNYDYAQIMVLGDHGLAFYGGACKKANPEDLLGASQIVYNSCLKAGLKPEIQGFRKGEYVEQRIVIPLGGGVPHPDQIACL